MQYRDPESGKTFIRKLRRDSHEPGHAYELTFSCYERYQFLSRNRTRTWFIEAVEDARRKLEFDLWAFVTMPEHVHLLIAPRNGEGSVGQIRGKIKESVGRKAIRYLEEHAPTWLDRITVREGNRVRRRFWQPGGGYDRNAIEIATVHSMISYIHMNPVRRGLVGSPTDWEWSSAMVCRNPTGGYRNGSDNPYAIFEQVICEDHALRSTSGTCHPTVEEHFRRFLKNSRSLVDLVDRHSTELWRTVFKPTFYCFQE